MPTKAKATSTSNDDVKVNTRASTSASIEEPIMRQIMAAINQLTSRFNTLEAEFAELKAAQVTQPPAPALALALAPAITPIIEPSTSLKSTPFRADEVGYFDPDLDADAEGDMVTIGKDL
jgi:hypothetical protein